MLNLNLKKAAIFAVLATLVVSGSGCNPTENPYAGDDAGVSAAPEATALNCNSITQSKDGALVICDGRLVCQDGKPVELGWAAICAGLVPSAKGDTGATGTNGKDGVSCFVSEKVNGCVTLSCAATEDESICDGQAINGKDGANGKDATPCTISNKANGCVTITCESNVQKICDGQAINGKDGANGQNGANGAPGKDGTNGTPGTPGKAGTDGANGVNGADGKDAAPCDVKLAADGCTLTITCPLSSVSKNICPIPPPISADAGSSDVSADTSSADAGDSASADTSADATATDVFTDATATDIAVSATGVDLVFTPPAPVMIYIWYQVDPTVDPVNSDSQLVAPYKLHLTWVQACGSDLDGVDIAAYDPLDQKWWCGPTADGTPTKTKIGVTVDGKAETPSLIIRPGACMGGPEGNLHFTKAQLHCPY